MAGSSRADATDGFPGSSPSRLQAEFTGLVIEDHIVEAVIFANRPLQLVAEKTNQLLEIRYPVEVCGAYISHQTVTFNLIPSMP